MPIVRYILMQGTRRIKVYYDRDIAMEVLKVLVQEHKSLEYSIYVKVLGEYE